MWLLDSHPYNPPMVFVKPTVTMQIKPGQHVDSNGKVYLPYLHDWRHVSISVLCIYSFNMDNWLKFISLLDIILAMEICMYTIMCIKHYQCI